MTRFVEGVDRTQSILFPASLDEYVAENNPVRVIEAFVDTLNLAALGFEGMIASLKCQIDGFNTLGKQLHKMPDQQISLTDPDARSMATSGRGPGMVGYNAEKPLRDDRACVCTSAIWPASPWH